MISQLHLVISERPSMRPFGRIVITFCPPLVVTVASEIGEVAASQIAWREAGPPNHHDDKVDSDQ